MHDQGDWPDRERGRGQEVLPAYESVYDDAEYQKSEWAYQASQARHDGNRLRNARAEQWDRYAPHRKVDGVYYTEGYARVRNGRVESDRPWERARSGYMYVQTSLTPGRWAPGSFVSVAQNVGHLPDGIYIDRSGRRWVRNTPGKDSSPAELSTQEKFDLAKSNLQKARAEFEGARYLIQSEIRDLPRPVTEEAKGISAVQKLGRRTRALTDAILAYKDTYEQARKAGLTEGGEKTADFTEREDDGHADSVWEQIIASGKARVPLDWDGLHLIPQEASPTREELDQSLRRLLSPRLGEDSTHVAAANSRYRERIDDLLIEGYNIREEGSFPEADADELVFQ